MIFQAKNYLTREDLEKDIINNCGQTTELKKDTVKGTAKELKNLQLSKNTTIWGVKINVVGAEKGGKVKNDKINRGNIYEGGINLKNK